MALLTWKEEYSVGVPSIDQQHSQLVSILNELHQAMMSGTAREVTGSLLKKLIEYTKTHFASEERLLSSTRFPDFDQHRKAHVDLVSQVSDFAARYEAGEMAVNLHLLNFLRDWLTSHILGADRQYSAWLVSHGIR